VAIENIKGTLSRDLQPDVFFPSAAKSHRFLNIFIDITEIFTVLMHIGFLGIWNGTFVRFPLTFSIKLIWFVVHFISGFASTLSSKSKFELNQDFNRRKNGRNMRWALSV
jgi:hypothetical protein